MEKAVPIIIALALAGTISTAVRAADSATAPKAKAPRSELIRRAQMRQFGGLVARPGSLRGRVVVADAGAGFGAEAAAVAEAFATGIRIRVETATTERPTPAGAPALVRRLDAQAALFVTDDAGLPTLLVAPEERWAIVSVARLLNGAPSDATARRRVRCEIARGLALLCGAADSAFPNSLMSAVTAPGDLDSVADEMPPAEVLARMPGYLKGLGVTPLVRVPYRRACEEGWAPPPTNDVQRAVWEKAHAVPDRPLTITFDPKRDK